MFCRTNMFIVFSSHDFHYAQDVFQDWSRISPHDLSWFHISQYFFGNNPFPQMSHTLLPFFHTPTILFWYLKKKQNIKSPTFPNLNCYCLIWQNKQDDIVPKSSIYTSSMFLSVRWISGVWFYSLETTTWLFYSFPKNERVSGWCCLIFLEKNSCSSYSLQRCLRSQWHLSLLRSIADRVLLQRLAPVLKTSWRKRHNGDDETKDAGCTNRG